MHVPLPVLVAIGGAFLALLLVVLMRRGGGRDLMAPPPNMAGQPGLRRARPADSTAAAKARMTPEFEEELRALLRAGRKIEAVKRVRDTTGVGLREAVKIVGRL